ncbi:UNVERIFIED_CONTAM: hypothetical protein HDU68_005085 [Siphonaria sp. JEL0065]|nr:hypothetical protein HDU68_005085 [Siphonaria sp. JEL0065]
MPNPDHEFIFIGTGTSSATCLTRKPLTCKVCLKAATWTPPTLTTEGLKRSSDASVQTPPSFNHNKRGNTSGLYRYRHSDGRMRNILIDCGKTFYASALQWFPYYDITTIDAVLITHGHADAIMGLDDLRQWTLKSDAHPELGPVQESIPIWLNSEAMSVIQGVFPYLVDRSRATGGGQIAALDFKVFDDGTHGDFELTEYGYPILKIEELQVIPFEVEHGKAKGNPYYCLGFKFPEITYISDTNLVPENAKKLVKHSPILVLDALRGNRSTSFNAPFLFSPLLIAKPIICSKDIEHPSHLSFNEAIQLGLELAPKRLFFTDFCHDLEHSDMEERLKSHSGLQQAGITAAPAYDGLAISLK